MRKLFFVFILASLNALSQVSVQDSCIFTPLVVTSYSYQIPGGDLAKRFGSNSNIGLSFLLKTKKNWMFGFDGSFIFGKKLKEDTILKNIYTKDNFVINKNGIVQS